jgi:hypothetical protein
MASDLTHYLEAKFENETGKGYYLLKAIPAGDSQSLVIQITFHANDGQAGINDFITDASNREVPAWAIGALKFDAGNIINFTPGLNLRDDAEILAAQNQATIEASQDYINSGGAAAEASVEAEFLALDVTFEEALQEILATTSQQNTELASQVPNQRSERFLKYIKLFGFSVSDLAEKIYDKGAIGWEIGGGGYSNHHMYGGAFIKQWLLQPAKAKFFILDAAGVDNQLQFVLPKTVRISDKKRVEQSQAGGKKRNQIPKTNWWKEAAPLDGVVLNREFEQIPSWHHRRRDADGDTRAIFFLYVDGDLWQQPPALYAPQLLYVPNIYIDEDETAKLAAESQQEIAERIKEDGVDWESGGLTEAQTQAKLPLSEQAILLYRLPLLATANMHRRYSGAYDRFAAIDADNQGELESIVNTITSPLNMGPLFDLIKPRHLSAAIPRIRLFKLYNVDDPRMKDVRNRDKEQRVVVEYELDEFLRESVLDEEGLPRTGNILGSTLSTNTGVGIEGFSWDFNGTNEFEAERLISANLKLRAQSVDALEERKYSSTSNNAPYKFSDLFIPNESEIEVPSTSKSNSNQYHSSTVSMYETRVLVEYGIDANNQVFTREPDDRKVLEALKRLRLTINMVINSYTIDLRDDGSVIVDINFTGRLEAHAKDPYFGNILPSNHAGKALKESGGSTFITERNMELYGDEKGLENPNSAKNLQHRLDGIKRKKSELTKKQERKEELSEEEEKQLKMYSSDIQTITKQIQDKKKKYKSEMSEEEYLKSLSTELDRLQLYQAIYGGLISRKAIHVLDVDPRNIMPSPTDPVSGYCDESKVQESGVVQNAIAEAAGSSLKIDFNQINTADFLKKRRIKMQESLMGAMTAPAFTNRSYKIPYIYFGDLIDTVLDNMLTNRDDFTHDIRTVLGPIVLKHNVFQSPEFVANVGLGTNGKIVVGDDVDTPASRELNELYLKASKESELTLSDRIEDSHVKADTTPIMANLADVPISFNLFLQWFADKVSNTGVYSYSLKAFMADAIRSLILAATQADSTQLILPKQHIKLENVIWQSSAERAKPDPLGFTQKKDEGLRCRLPEDKNREILPEWKSMAPAPTPNFVSQMPDPPKKFARRKLTVADLKNASRQKNAAMPMGQVSLSGLMYDSDYMMVYALPADWDRKYAPSRPVAAGGITEYERDLNDGIYHLESGRDAGIVKQISLTAYPSEGYEEMQIMNALKGGKRPTNRVYKATVKLNGATFFRPGQTVYINAAAYGNFKTLQKFGLCGYYTVTTTSSRISSGEFETELVCDFRTKGEHTD